jgi:hypothetical protein
VIAINENHIEFLIAALGEECIAGHAMRPAALGIDSDLAFRNDRIEALIGTAAYLEIIPAAVPQTDLIDDGDAVVVDAAPVDIKVAVAGNGLLRRIGDG